ncbi:hypothetical protein CYMTET_23851 [Cymbomonas tetramitiformis]|uniref:Uncharacterized protein n=1 Tax=Cymbomonas tetramitiformis TaxID=36881 RepID=A0AAE0L0T2_9CHLO|nr:hypothetical protein CYMTET_23851 [Cymbomonas tetramitiformis]
MSCLQSCANAGKTYIRVLSGLHLLVALAAVGCALHIDPSVQTVISWLLIGLGVFMVVFAIVGFAASTNWGRAYLNFFLFGVATTILAGGIFLLVAFTNRKLILEDFDELFEDSDPDETDDQKRLHLRLFLYAFTGVMLLELAGLLPVLMLHCKSQQDERSDNLDFGTERQRFSLTEEIKPISGPASAYSTGTYTQSGKSGQASGGAGEAQRTASQLLDSMEDGIAALG